MNSAVGQVSEYFYFPLSVSFHPRLYLSIHPTWCYEILAVQSIVTWQICDKILVTYSGCKQPLNKSFW